MVGGIDSGSFGLFSGFGEVVFGGLVPVQSFIVFVLFEKSQEICHSNDKTVIVDEGFCGYFLVDLFFASDYELYVVDGEGGDEEVKVFEVFAAFGGHYFAEGFYHQIQIVYFFTEFLLEGLQNLIQLAACCF